MHQAGLTTMQILQSATSTAARIFDTHGGTSFRSSPTLKLGSVALGNFADLVVRNSNPLDDIAHASDIQSVMKNGVIYAADQVLAESR